MRLALGLALGVGLAALAHAAAPPPAARARGAAAPGTPAATPGTPAAAPTGPAAPARPLSDVLRAPRPAGPEFFGLYLMGKKVGWLSTELRLDGERAVSSSEVSFTAQVGPRKSERRMREVRIYEAKPRGRLLSLTVEQRGDGGEQHLEATATPSGLRLLRRRPGFPNETRTLAVPDERVEDADQVRVAALRRATVRGRVVDGTDLESYEVTTSFDGPSTRSAGGVRIKALKLTTLSQKEKVPAEAWLDERGRVLEVAYGATMRAVAEPAETAKRLDLIEVFGLTRVVLPSKPPRGAFTVPGTLRLTLSALPEKFRVATARQQFRALPDGTVEVSIRAVAPSKRLELPLADPEGGENLKSTLVVESDDPELRALAQRIAGDARDAYAVSLEVARWVFENVQKDYGSSSDRARDVLRTLRGDCTEHSLLTVALLRALGVPSRRVDGVVYVLNDDGVPALYWHEWVEAFVGEWTHIDPTFGQDVADATHLALGREGNAEITPLIGTLEVRSLR